MAWKATEGVMDTIRHYANFPATGVSLRQMVQFGERPSTGMAFWPLENWVLRLQSMLADTISLYRHPLPSEPVPV